MNYGRRQLEDYGVLRMNFREFEKAALKVLIGKQLENGSWLNDDAATCSAMDTLLEAFYGPRPICKHSWLYRQAHPAVDVRSPVDLRFSYGMPRRNGSKEADYMSALYKGFRFGWAGRLARDNLWLMAKWLRLFSITDPDFWPGFFPHGLYSYPDEQYRCPSEEPWQIAQLALARLHFDIPNEFGYGLGPILRKSYIALDVERLLQHQNLEFEFEDTTRRYWKSERTSQEECTAIVVQFLSDPCTASLLNKLSTALELQRVFDAVRWLILRQRTMGDWDGSPHVTSQCLRALATVLDSADILGASGADVSLCRGAIGRGVKYLAKDDTVELWDALDSYRQIEVFGTLISLSRIPVVFDDLFNSLEISSRALNPDVFVSYGGCDSEFATKLSRDLENAGVRVWFAGWDIDYGNDVVQEIQSGLERTRAFLIVLSPQAIERNWVRKELSAAFTQALDGPGKTIIPLMLRETKPPSFLATHKWIDFAKPDQYEEKVADLARRLKGRSKQRL
jgi:hypothetical protein